VPYQLRRIVNKLIAEGVGGYYVKKILDGPKRQKHPARADKRGVIINLKTAKALGIPVRSF